MNASTQQLIAALRQQVEAATVECPAIPLSSGGCQRADGTWEGGIHATWCRCGGSGRIPNPKMAPRLEVWREVAARYNPDWGAPILWPNYSSEGGLIWVFQWPAKAIWGEAGTALEAVLRALEAAAQAEDMKP